MILNSIKYWPQYTKQTDKPNPTSTDGMDLVRQYWHVSGAYDLFIYGWMNNNRENDSFLSDEIAAQKCWI